MTDYKTIAESISFIFESTEINHSLRPLEKELQMRCCDNPPFVEIWFAFDFERKDD